MSWANFKGAFRTKKLDEIQGSLGEIIREKRRFFRIKAGLVQNKFFQ